MAVVVSTTIKSNTRRIWGKFKLSDKSTTKFEMKKEEGWFQWGNTTDKLCLTTEKVDKICRKWAEK